MVGTGSSVYYIVSFVYFKFGWENRWICVWMTEVLNEWILEW